MYRVLSQGVKGESVKHGGGKTSELHASSMLCIELFHKGLKVNQSSVVEVKQVSCYASSMLCIELFHKGLKVNQSSVVEVKQMPQVVEDFAIGNGD